MSYDYPDGYVPPPREPLTLRDRAKNMYWAFVLWCILDSGRPRLERWGERQLDKHGGRK